MTTSNDDNTTASYFDPTHHLDLTKKALAHSDVYGYLTKEEKQNFLETNKEVRHESLSEIPRAIRLKTDHDINECLNNPSETIIEALNNAKELILAGTNIDDLGVKTFSDRCPRIKKLNLANCKNISDLSEYRQSN